MARKSGRTAQKKSSQSQSSRQNSSSRSEGLAGRFEDATSAITTAANRIPSSTIYWGLGGLALGAMAVGAYLYREQLAGVYEEAMTALTGSGEDSDRYEANETGRKSKSSSSLSQVDSH